MIPKIIHYIWLGGKPLPKIAKKCFASWKKFCPDFEIKRWDENSLNLEANKYVKQAFEAKKFAFASDYFRFEILYKEGGIYMDIDVELLKPIDDLLSSECFTGFETKNSINPGLIIGAEKGNVDIKNLMNSYNNDNFLKQDNTQNLTTICERTFLYFKEKGLKEKDETQKVSTAKIYASEYFNPTNLSTQKIKITKNTYCIHHYNASWYSPLKKFKKGVKTFLNKITFGLFGKMFLKK